MEIKDLIIFLLIFIVVLWLQHNDDKKYNKSTRIALYDIIKLPLFVSLIILIVKDLNCKIYDNFEAIFITTNVNTDLNNNQFIDKYDNQFNNKYDNLFNNNYDNLFNNKYDNQFNNNYDNLFNDKFSNLLNTLPFSTKKSDSLNDIFLGPPDF